MTDRIADRRRRPRRRPAVESLERRALLAGNLSADAADDPGLTHLIAGESTNVALASFFDSDPAADSSEFTATISSPLLGAPVVGQVVPLNDAGDGADEISFQVEASITASGAGTAPLTVAIAQADGSTLTITYEVTSAFGPFTLADEGFSIPVGDSLASASSHGGGAVVQNFGDLDPSLSAASFGAVVDWGDGTPGLTIAPGSTDPSARVVADPSGGYDVLADHAYNQSGSFDLRVTLHAPGDASGDGLESDDLIDVNDVVPTPKASGPLVGAAGRFVEYKVATFDDENPAGTTNRYVATIDWGDGDSTTTEPIASAGGSTGTITAGHAYADAGRHAPTVTLADAGGPYRILAQAAGGGAAAAADAPPLTAAIVPSSAMRLRGTSLSTTDPAITFRGTTQDTTDPIVIYASHPGDGRTIYTGTTTPASDGSWVFTTSALPDGRYQFLVQQPDPSIGEPYPVEAFPTPRGLLDDVLVTRPVTPTGAVVLDSRVSQVGSELVSPSGLVDLTGLAPGAATVRVLAFPVAGGNPTILGVSNLDAAGEWSQSDPLPRSGRYNIAVFAFDADVRLIGAKLLLPGGSVADVRSDAPTVTVASLGLDAIADPTLVAAPADSPGPAQRRPPGHS